MHKKSNKSRAKRNIILLIPERFYFWLCLFAHPDLLSSSSFSLLGLSGQTSDPSWKRDSSPVQMLQLFHIL